MIITDPSNPCGSVFSKRHVTELISVAARHCIPLVTDEVYNNMTFDRVKNYRVTDINEDVPVITCGGIAKRYLVPGWRLGWIVIFDKKGILAKAVSGY